MTLPTVATVKRLFAVSGNQCAFPKCPLPLVDEGTGKVTGRICHIKARKAGGPRYDPEQPDEQRNDFSNLLLLCPIHHDVIDSDIVAYTVERLLEMKSANENKMPEAVLMPDEVVEKLISFSVNTVASSSVVSKDQVGGQTADRITNILLPSASTGDFHAEMERRRYEHDVKIFQQSNAILDEERLNQGLDLVRGDHSYRDSFLGLLLDFAQFFERVQNQFLNSELADMSQQLSKSLRKLTGFLATHFFVYPEHRNFDDAKHCLYPELNIDRAGRGNADEIETYDKFVQELNDLVSETWEAFLKYRKAVKESLLI